jgi:hypothetical protein
MPITARREPLKIADENWIGGDDPTVEQIALIPAKSA